MPWRVIQQGDRRWQVSAAAERRPSISGWSLVFCFRCPGHRPVWAPAPVTFPSKAELYRHADQISDADLLNLLGQAEAGAAGRARPPGP